MMMCTIICMMICAVMYFLEWLDEDLNDNVYYMMVYI